MSTLYSRFGIEIEYMIVDRESLVVRPIADQLLFDASGSYENACLRGNMGWSNELVMHVIEIKTEAPRTDLAGLGSDFQTQVTDANHMLAKHDAILLPTAMHPFFDPVRETRLWPHGDQEIYQAFDKVFNCRGHGWSNLQSTHINLPFGTDDEFVRLHSAIRLLLPLMPALAASSPIYEGKRAHMMDMRLEFYRKNCRRIPSVTGKVIPEPIHSIQEYHERILNRIYADIAPYDPDSILQEEWTNARGVIARFERNTLEIRVLDCQECPRADVAIVQFIVAILRHLTEGALRDPSEALKQQTNDLENLFLRTITYAEDSLVQDESYLSLLGLDSKGTQTVGDILHQLLQKLSRPETPWRKPIEHILRRGCLSRRIRRATGRQPSHTKLVDVYQQLAHCLREGIQFDA